MVVGRNDPAPFLYLPASPICDGAKLLVRGFSLAESLKTAPGKKRSVRMIAAEAAGATQRLVDLPPIVGVQPHDQVRQTRAGVHATGRACATRRSSIEIAVGCSTQLGSVSATTSQISRGQSDCSGRSRSASHAHFAAPAYSSRFLPASTPAVSRTRRSTVAGMPRQRPGSCCTPISPLQDRPNASQTRQRSSSRSRRTRRGSCRRSSRSDHQLCEALDLGIPSRH
jgi:hypothetical protein